MRFCCCSTHCCNVLLLLLQGTSASCPHWSSFHVFHLRPELQARVEPAQSHHKTPCGETQEREGKKGWPPKAAVQISYFLWLIYMTGFIYCLRFRFLLQTNWLHQMGWESGSESESGYVNVNKPLVYFVSIFWIGYCFVNLIAPCPHYLGRASAITQLTMSDI